MNTEINKNGGNPPVSLSALYDSRAEVAALWRRQGLRIRDLRKASGQSIEEMAQRVHMHANTLGRIERGENECSLDQLLAIARGLGVNPATLSHFAHEEATNQSVPDEEFALVDMLDVRVSGGGGSINGSHEVIGRFAFKRKWLSDRGLKPEYAKIVRASGNSMADRINEGDILLVNTAVRHLVQDGIYVIEIDGMDYVKLLQRDFANGGLFIISYNTAYKTISLSSEQAENLRISGRVVWHGGEL